MKTRIARIVEERKIEIFEEEVPALKQGEVLVKLKAVGICGSDLHYFRHCGLGSFKNPLPIDIGHEPSGQIVDSKHDSFRAGDRVAIEPGINCGKCEFCNKGLFNMCSNTKFLGANDVGAFRDYIVLEPERVMKIADTVSYEKAALLEPIGVALHAKDRVRVNLNMDVAILGAGTIGLLIASVMKKSGCKVTMLDPILHRLSVASSIFNVNKTYCTKETLPSDLKNKFDIVFDAVGVQGSLDNAVQLVRPTGQICMVGIPEVDVLQINPHKMRIKEVTLTNSRRSNQKMHDAYELYMYDMSVENIVTHHFKLDEIQKAFELSSDYLDKCIKIVIME